MQVILEQNEYAVVIMSDESNYNIRTGWAINNTYIIKHKENAWEKCISDQLYTHRFLLVDAQMLLLES